MHVNIVKGDYVFKQWDTESFRAMYEKFKELEEQGYEMVNEEHGPLNVYFHFEKEGCEEIVVTLMCF